MSVAPVPSEIYDRAVEEGKRRLDQSLLELVSTSFIAGFTIVFGIIGLAVVEAAAEPSLGELAKMLGALAFAPGVVFLIIGKAELFSENFFDPVAKAFDKPERAVFLGILRLWIVTFALNVVGGALFMLILSVPGVLSEGAEHVLRGMAEEIAGRGAWAAFVAGILGGGLVALLSFLTLAVNQVGSRISLCFFVGFLLAAGPFDHVIVTGLITFGGMLFDASVSYETLGSIMAIATAGNLVGGVGLVTLSHVAQAKGAKGSGE